MVFYPRRIKPTTAAASPPSNDAPLFETMATAPKALTYARA